MLYFNSRPHGGRHGFIVPLANFFHFNSRPHGGRQRTRADDNTGGVFQLTPSRRATSLYFWIASSSGLFQLTPSRRATINPAITLATTLFQLTPSRRATSTLPSSSVIPVFQLTPSRRATTLRKSGAWNCEDFNSRPHGGRRPYPD